MAERVEPVPATVESPMPAADPPTIVDRPRADRKARRYRVRFLLAYLALALIAAAGIAGGVYVFDLGPVAEEPEWSTWKPTGRESSFPSQIADHVSDRYKLPNGNPLVGILSGPPWVQAPEGRLPVETVLIEHDPEGAAEDISIVPVQNSLMYVLCGLGPQCSIKGGQPSAERHRLLRREALELALYTFKYTEVDSVIALLPPRIDTDPTGAQTLTSSALFLQKDHFRTQLDRPLDETLLTPGVPRMAALRLERSPQSQVVEDLTREHLYTYEFRQTQRGDAVIVFARIPET